MIFALDFDETYNRDPVLFDNLILILKFLGHSVILATYRHRETDWDPLFDGLVEQEVTCYFTDGKAKKPFLEEQGVTVDIWIDDNPRSILEDSAWKDDSPELHAWREENKKKLELKEEAA